MKKYILFLISLLFLNTVYSQVLYVETFDNYTLGNLGTDPNSVILGQGSWYTSSFPNHQKNNSNYRIVNEPNKGKVLEVSCSPTDYVIFIAFKNLSYNINQRTPGNNVIKFQIDFYPGYQAYGNTSSRSHIRLFNYNNDKGIYDVFFDVHDETANRSSPAYLSFNVW